MSIVSKIQGIFRVFGRTRPQGADTNIVDLNAIKKGRARALAKERRAKAEQATKERWMKPPGRD